MRIRNATPDMVRAVMARLAELGYDLEIKSGPDMVTKNTVSVALRAKTSNSIGARKSWSGRRGPWACWHVFRDFSREMFKVCPDAVLTTTLARYTADNFENEYPETDYVLNVDCYMSDLCECEGEHGE